MPEKVNRPEADVIDEDNEQYKDATESNLEWYERAISSYRFYTSLQQWDPEILLQLAKEGRPALTINKIFPYINLLWGFQSQNRNDIKLYPRSGGSVAVAALGTELIKHTLDTCEGQDEISDAFGDGLICGKGWYGLEHVFENDVINGDLIVEKKSPFSIVEDQNNRSYNINKGMYLFETYWWTKDQVELQWPKKAKELKGATENPQYLNEVYYPADSSAEEAYKDPTNITEDDRRKTHYHIRERWYKKWENCVFIVHLPTLTPRLLSPAKLKLVKEKELLRGLESEFRIIERVAPIMYKSIKVGDLLLEHTKDPLDGICLFPFFRYCPYYIDGYILSPVDICKEMQMEHNKRRSQVLHHLNSSAHSGFYVDKVIDETEKEKLEQFGSKPGLVIDKSKLGGGVEPILPTPLDAGHFMLSEQSGNDMKETWGINTAILEKNPEPKESGRAKIARQQIGMMPSQKLFDNFARTLRTFGFTTWEIIRTSNIYSEEEIEAVVQQSTLKGFLKMDPISGKQVVDLSPMRSWRFGKYGVTVSQSPNIPTVRAAEFEQLMAYAKEGFPIPPELIIESSDILKRNKEEVLAYIKQKQGQAVPGAAQPRPALTGVTG